MPSTGFFCTILKEASRPTTWPTSTFPPKQPGWKHPTCKASLSTFASFGAERSASGRRKAQRTWRKRQRHMEGSLGFLGLKVFWRMILFLFLLVKLFQQTWTCLLFCCFGLPCLNLKDATPLSALLQVWACFSIYGTSSYISGTLNTTNWYSSTCRKTVVLYLWESIDADGWEFEKRKVFHLKAELGKKHKRLQAKKPGSARRTQFFARNARNLKIATLLVPNTKQNPDSPKSKASKATKKWGLFQLSTFFFFIQNSEQKMKKNHPNKQKPSKKLTKNHRHLILPMALSLHVLFHRQGEQGVFAAPLAETEASARWLGWFVAFSLGPSLFPLRLHVAENSGFDHPKNGLTYLLRGRWTFRDGPLRIFCFSEVCLGLSWVFGYPETAHCTLQSWFIPL